MNEAMGDSEKLAFWGIQLKPGEPADLDLEDGETLHVSMASFGVELADKSGRSVVTATIKNSEDDGEPEKKYALSALTAGKTETVCMDISFIGEESITFEVSGKNVVHLIGNFSFENDLSDSESDDDDGSNLIGVYDDDEDASDLDEDEQMPRLIMDDDPPVITELPEEDDSSAKGKRTLSKKGGSSSKIANGKAPEPSSKKAGKQDSSKAPKASGKKPQKKIKVNEPLVEDESEEEEEDSEDESDGDTEIVKNTGKKETEAISDDEDDGDEDSDMNDAEMDDSEDEDEEEDVVKKNNVAVKPRTSKRGKAAKPSVVFKEVPSRSSAEDPRATPTNAKGKRQRKQGTAAGSAEGVTPPQTKKSKISERPGTPAPSKSASKSKTSGEPASSSKSKKTKANGAGPSSGKKAAAASASDVPSTPEPTPQKENASTPTGSGTTGKRKRRRSKKGGGS